MIDSVTELIKAELFDYVFVDKISGVVTETRELGDGKTVKIFPKATDVFASDCEFGVEVAMIPDSKYKSVIYFEDNGTTANDPKYETRLRLVAWLNMNKLGEVDNSNMLVDAITATLIKAVEKVSLKNSGYLRKVTVKVKQIVGKNSNPFSRWTYNEEVTQYITWPYRWTALDLVVTYEIGDKCLPNITLQLPIDCLGKKTENQASQLDDSFAT